MRPWATVRGDGAGGHFPIFWSGRRPARFLGWMFRCNGWAMLLMSARRPMGLELFWVLQRSGFLPLGVASAGFGLLFSASSHQPLWGSQFYLHIFNIKPTHRFAPS